MPHVRQKYKTMHEECPLHPDKAWRWLPGFEDRLMVSSCGDIRMHKSYGGQGEYVCDPPRILCQTYQKNRYKSIQIQTQRTRCRFYVHRLVLFTFCPDPAPGMEVAHLDGTRDNNHLSNLRWVTRKENALHRHQHGTCPCHLERANVEQLRQRSQYYRHSTPTNAKLTPRVVLAVRKAVANGERQASVARRLHLNRRTVSDIVLRKIWVHLP